MKPFAIFWYSMTASVLLMSSCVQDLENQPVFWTRSSGTPEPQVADHLNLAESFEVAGLKVELYKELDFNDPLRSMKRVSQKEIGTVAVSGRAGWPLTQQDRLAHNKMQARRSKMVLQIEQMHSDLVWPKGSYKIERTRWRGEPMWVYKRSALDVEKGQVQNLMFNFKGDFLSEEIEHPCHFSAEATAMSLNTRALTEVELSDLIGNGRLQTTHYRVQSEAITTAYSEEHRFHYPPQHTHFDQVQVFYALQSGWRRLHDWAEFPWPRLTINVGLNKDKPSNAAFYHDRQVYLGRGDGVKWREIPRDPTIVLHEAGHAIVDVIAGLPSRGEGGSINEAFADFFAATSLDEPEMAKHSYLRKPFKRTIDNTRRAVSDWNGKKYNDSLVISGTLWDIRQRIGDKSSVIYGFRVLAMMDAYSDFSVLSEALFAVADDWESTEEQQEIMNVLIERSWDRVNIPQLRADD